MLISVVVTTYNRPDALQCVLQSLVHQSDQAFEILVADDGSEGQTKHVIDHFIKTTSLSLTHIWHEDLGFRAAAIRNKAATKAKGDYLIFLDGDCALPLNFIKNHKNLAEKGFFVAGNRILLSEKATAIFLKTQELFFRRNLWQWIKSQRRGECNRWLPLVTIPLGVLRKLQPHKWKGAKTCNLGMFRQDFIAVNGFDENYIGWGFEDSDLIIRLQNYGIKRKAGQYSVPVFHLWHPHNSKPELSLENFSRLQATLKSKNTGAITGVNQYLSL